MTNIYRPNGDAYEATLETNPWLDEVSLAQSVVLEEGEGASAPSHSE